MGWLPSWHIRRYYVKLCCDFVLWKNYITIIHVYYYSCNRTLSSYTFSLQLNCTLRIVDIAFRLYSLLVGVITILTIGGGILILHSDVNLGTVLKHEQSQSSHEKSSDK